ncbi:MAG: cytochrome c oxidase assembly protein [Alphaproteobacteria bacterium]
MAGLGLRKTTTALVLFGPVVGMLGLTYYGAVPLYRLFCQVTGYGGTTQVAAETPTTVVDHTVTVRFNADVGKGMPWRFRPARRSMSLRLGETGLATFIAENPTDEAIVGTATFNVTPQKAGVYFNKIECFCFTEQRLEPGERVEMPVSFFVDPAILDGSNVREVKTITLSYTFFKVEGDTALEAPVEVSVAGQEAPSAIGTRSWTDMP